MFTSMFKIKTNDDNDLFLFTQFDPNKKLDVKMLNIAENEAFCGHVNEIGLRSMAVNIRMTYNNFIEETRKALCSPNTEEEEFSYSFEKKFECFSFKWKKRIPSEDITISLGSMEVNKTDFASVVSDIWSLSAKELRDLNGRVETLSEHLEKSESKQRETIELLSTASEAKDSLEKELFSKFLVIVNSKKQRIRELKRKANNIDAPLSKKDEKTKTVRVKKRIFKKVIISDSSDDIDDDVNNTSLTTSASNSSSSKQPALNFFDDKLKTDSLRKRNVNKPSTSKTSHSKRLSLNFFDNDSEIEDQPIVKTNNVRNRKAVGVDADKLESLQYEETAMVQEQTSNDSDTDELLGDF